MKQQSLNLKLMYITYQGCEWLTETVTLINPTKESAEKVFHNYIKSNQERAKQLSDKWIEHGESKQEAGLTPYVECDDTRLQNHLNTYGDSIA